MHGPATERYLETEVLTAPAHKLQLMLIEGAIRATQRAQLEMQADNMADACERLIRAQQIITEMLSGLNREVDGPLARKVASVYLFIFRRLMEANTQRDPQKLDDVLRVLRVERDTWVEVGRKVGTDAVPEGAKAGNRGIGLQGARGTGDHAGSGESDESTGVSAPGLSLEA